MPLRTQNIFSVISALGSPGPACAPPPLGVGGWCWLGYRLPISWCYWGYPIVPMGLYHWIGSLAHIPSCLLINRMWLTDNITAAAALFGSQYRGLVQGGALAPATGELARARCLPLFLHPPFAPKAL
jgi:hypothetical protein